jgi:hypothetical protein
MTIYQGHCHNYHMAVAEIMYALIVERYFDFCVHHLHWVYTKYFYSI